MATSEETSGTALGDELTHLQEERNLAQAADPVDDKLVASLEAKIRAIFLANGTKFEAMMSEHRSRVVLPEEIEDEDEDAQYLSIPIVTNSFPAKILIPDDAVVHKYDIRFEGEDIDPKSSSKEESLALIENDIREAIGFDEPISYDADRLIAYKRVPEFSIEYRGVRVRFVPNQQHKWGSLKKQHQMGLAHNWLKPLLHECGLEKMTRDYYDQNSILDVPHTPDLQFIQGYRLSIEACSDFSYLNNIWTNGYVLTVDPCYRILSKETLLEKMMQLKDRSKSNKDYERAVLKELKYESFVCLELKKARAKMKIERIVFDKNVDTYMLTDKKTGEEISLREFIKREHRVSCQSSENGIIIHQHDLKHGETTPQIEAFPPEFCKTTGKPKGIRKNVRKCRQLANNCKLSAEMRQQKITELMNNLRAATLDVQGMADRFEVNCEMKQVQGRLLAEGKVVCEKKHGQSTKSVAYSMNDLQKSLKSTSFIFHGPRQQLKNARKNARLGDGEWMIVHAMKRKPKMIQKLIKKMCEHGPTKELLSPRPVEICVSGNGETPWLKGIPEALEENPEVRAVVIVLPKGDSEVDALYASLKNLLTSECGIISQCVKEENISNDHVQNGITRQLFTKLGVKGLSACVPWKLKFTHTEPLKLTRTPTMLVGLDVNQNKGSQKSAIGMVSSFDRDFVQYHSQLDWQKAKQEEMDTSKMQEMMQKALQNFHDRNRCYPKQVILYRDGVADSQMEKIYNQEIKGIRQAFDDISTECQPKLVYIITQKRVNARFMFEKGGQMHNVPLGTIVDNGVVSSGAWDWYMVPAAAPEGCTSTPTRFIVLVDDLNIASDPKKVLALESFTKQLCNLYYNWSGPVRIPSCVKNADKLSQQFGSKIGPKSNNYQGVHSNLKNLYHYL